MKRLTQKTYASSVLMPIVAYADRVPHGLQEWRRRPDRQHGGIPDVCMDTQYIELLENFCKERRTLSAFPQSGALPPERRTGTVHNVTRCILAGVLWPRAVMAGGRAEARAGGIGGQCPCFNADNVPLLIC